MIIWKMKCSSSDRRAQEEVSPKVLKGEWGGKHNWTEKNVKSIRSFTMWSNWWCVSGPTILKAEWRGAWHGFLSSHQWFTGGHSWSPRQQGESAARLRNAGSQDHRGPQLQLDSDAQRDIAKLSFPREQSAQVHVLAPLQISNEVIRVASVTFPGREAFISSPSQTLFSLVPFYAPVSQCKGLVMEWDQPVFRSSLPICLSGGLL